MEAPRNLVIEPRELDKFIEWLPSLEPHQAYLVQLMIRSRGLKEQYGFKGTDHVLMFKAVHGYLRATLKGDARKTPYWRIRLRNDILRLGLLGAQGTWEYANYEPGRNDVIRMLLRVPWQLIALYININPADTLKAAELTAKEIMDAMYNMARTEGLEAYAKFFRRPDQRYYANLARSTKTRFHTIDVDTEELSRVIYDWFVEAFGYRPPTIRTQRGIHILVDLEHLKRIGKERLYIGNPMHKMTIHGVTVADALSWYKSNRRNPRADQAKLERYRRILEEYAANPEVPFHYRVRMLGELHQTEDGAPLVEAKKQALEPVPGTIYKGRVVVRFDPGDNAG